MTLDRVCAGTSDDPLTGHDQEGSEGEEPDQHHDEHGVGHVGPLFRAGRRVSIDRLTVRMLEAQWP